ncbi:3-deoxy-7-phosphoheptulonate synthase, partial [Clostridium perfringens]
MIVILKPGTKEEEILKLIKKMNHLELRLKGFLGREMCVIGLVGDT